MKQNRSGLSFLVVITLVLIASLWFLGGVLQAGAQIGSLYYQGKHGLSLFRETMEVANRPLVVYDPKMATTYGDRAIHILPLNVLPLDFPQSQLEERVEEIKALGGVENPNIIALRYNGNMDVAVYRDVVLQSESPYTTYNGYVLKNNVLPFERDLAARVVEAISKIDEGPWVYHNDLIVNSVKPKHFMEAVPLWIKLVLLQILILVLLYFMAKGRKFGFLQEDYDEVERTPAAFLNAVSGYYKRYQCHDQILGAFWRALLKQLPKDMHMWPVIAAEAGIPLKALEHFKALNDANWANISPSTLLKYCQQINHMTLAIRKARKLKWHNR